MRRYTAAMMAAARYHPLAKALLTGWKWTLSPVFMACGVRCRHEPSCSEYAAEACSRHGLWAGAWMGLARFSRCRPGGSCGHDPVPDRTTTDARWWTPWRHGDWRGPRPDGARSDIRA